MRKALLKGISWILVLLMLAGLLPTWALASGEPDPAGSPPDAETAPAEEEPAAEAEPTETEAAAEESVVEEAPEPEEAPVAEEVLVIEEAPAPEEEPALDVNGDSSVNNKDVTRLMRYIKYNNVEIY